MKNPKKSGKGVKPKTYAEAVEALGLTLEQALNINQKKYKKERRLMRDSGLAVWKASPKNIKKKSGPSGQKTGCSKGKTEKPD